MKTRRTPTKSLNVMLLASQLSMIAALTIAASTSKADTLFRQLKLVSDQPGVAEIQDTNLVNAWGVSFSSGSPFWISDNGTGKSTLYAVTNDATGRPHAMTQGLVVNIPGEGNVTGQAFNNVGGFNGDIFLFVSEDGTVSGWRPALGTNAEPLATRTGAVYKGATLAMGASGPLLLAANFAEGTVDAYGTNKAMAGQFTDPHTPSGYAPFNVQSVEGMIFVTFAKQNDEKKDDVPGQGHGLIDVLDPVTGAFHRLVTGSAVGGNASSLNSPWGLAIAPSTFGAHAGQLLVGNFGSGRIATFDAWGRSHGFLRRGDDQPLVIPGLWALTLGNGARAGGTNQLFFTAGPDGESHGLFGSIVPVRRSGQNDQGENNQGENEQRLRSQSENDAY